MQQRLQIPAASVFLSMYCIIKSHILTKFGRTYVPDELKISRESVVFLLVIPFMSSTYFVLFNSIYTGIALVYWPMCGPIDENQAKSLQNSYPPAKKPGDFAFYGTFDE